MDTEVNDYNSSQNNDTEIEKKSEISIPSGIYNNNNNNSYSNVVDIKL